MESEMTIEEVEKIIKESENPEELDWAKEFIIRAIKEGEAHIANYYGMTLEAERRVMKNAISLIREVVDDYVFGCDSGCEDWVDFYTGISDELDEMVEKADRPSDFCYHLPNDAWLFMELISWNTKRGGHGSALKECAKIGKILKGEDYDDD